MLLYGEVLKELSDGAFLFFIEKVEIIHDVFKSCRLVKSLSASTRFLSTSSKSLMSNSPQK